MWKIQQSLEYSASARIELNEELEFSWTSVLQSKKKFWTNGVFVYEVVFTLVTRALAHYNYAAQLVSEQTQEVEQARAGIIQASKELRIGAGILSFVSATMLPRWQNVPESIPPEASVEVTAYLSSLFLCAAQRLTVAAAVLKKSPKKLVAQLLLGLEANYKTMERKLQAIPKKERGSLIAFIKDEPMYFASVARGLAFKFLAMHTVDAAESSNTPDVHYGLATAQITAAWETMRSISLPDSLKSVRTALKAETTNIGEKYSEIQSDNSKVYYGKVPDLDDVELPAQQFLPKPVEFDMPKINVVSFAAVEEAESSPPRPSQIPQAPPQYTSNATAPPPYPVSNTPPPAYAPPAYATAALACPAGVDPECK